MSDFTVNRRSFLAWTAATGATTALVSSGVFSGEPGVGPAQAAAASDASGEKIVWSACTVNCGSRCPLRLVVKDGAVTRVLPDDTGDDEIGTQQIRA